MNRAIGSNYENILINYLIYLFNFIYFLNRGVLFESGKDSLGFS